MADTKIAPTKSQIAKAEKGNSLWSDAFRRLRKNKLAMFGGIVIILILALCFLGPTILSWFDKFEPYTPDFQDKFSKPGEGGVFGKDQLGRDLFARVLEGGQISLTVAILATLITVTVGVIYGGISGYVGKFTDTVMMRIVDGLLAMPFLIIVILFRELITEKVTSAASFLVDKTFLSADIVSRFANLLPLILAIAAFGWLTMARIVRTSAASLAKQEFVEAARSLGLSHTRILFRHILPNMLGPVIIYATLTIPSFILYEATLSFIGLGIQPPYASWGILIKEGAFFLERPTFWFSYFQPSFFP